MEITLERVNSDYLFEAKNTKDIEFLDNRSKNLELLEALVNGSFTYGSGWVQ